MTMHTCPCSTLGPGPHDIEATHVNPKACEHAEYPVTAQTPTPGEEVRTLFARYLEHHPDAQEDEEWCMKHLPTPTEFRNALYREAEA